MVIFLVLSSEIHHLLVTSPILGPTKPVYKLYNKDPGVPVPKRTSSRRALVPEQGILCFCPFSCFCNNWTHTHGISLLIFLAQLASVV